MNIVVIMGNITRDIELKNLQGGQCVANIGVALNRKFKDANGETKEETTFVDCEAWGKTAENIARFFSKGRKIVIYGRLKMDQWEKDGQKHSKLKVVVEGFEFCDSKPDASQAVPPAKPTTARPGAGPKAPAGMDLPDEGIPF